MGSTTNARKPLRHKGKRVPKRFPPKGNALHDYFMRKALRIALCGYLASHQFGMNAGEQCHCGLCDSARQALKKDKKP